MKIAIIADIHSNLEAFEAVLQDILNESAEEIICLGDIIGYGPDPLEVVQLIRKHSIASVLGNHEYALCNPAYLNRLNPSPRASLDLNLKQLNRKDIDYLKSLPPVMTRHGALFVHGCPPKSPTAYLLEPSDKMLGKIFGSFPEQFAFYGHTHVFEFFESKDGEIHKRSFEPGIYSFPENGRYLVNPGSVGQPRDGFNNQAKYCLWDRDSLTLELKSIPYDVKKTASRLRKSGYPDFNAERLFY